jgi:preprotein translocase SecE subunit
MAREKTTDSKKTSIKGRVKKAPTVRERTLTVKSDRKRRLRSGAAKVGSPIKKVARVGKREYHLPLPDNKFGRFLKKRIRLWPRYFSESWREIKQVTWPNRRETIRLTVAVGIFSLIFGITVALLDYGLDKVFREVIVKK